MELTGKTALITGAGQNIGKSIALAFAEQGANVIICDINEAAAKSTMAEIQKLGVKCDIQICDVRDRKKVFSEVERLSKVFGGIDILVNNAGGSAALLGKITHFVDAEEETIDFVLDVNIKGTMNFIQAVLPQMMQRKQGKIINMASIAAVCGLQTRADYSAAKAAVIGLTQTLAMEVGQYDICVNCISPGAIEKNGQYLQHMTFMGEDGHSGSPDYIAEATVFLAKHDFITGQNLVVDGGRVLGPGSR